MFERGSRSIYIATQENDVASCVLKQKATNIGGMASFDLKLNAFDPSVRPETSRLLSRKSVPFRCSAMRMNSRRL